MFISQSDGMSSSGRTPGFGPGSGGSSPSIPATKKRVHWARFFVICTSKSNARRGVQNIVKSMICTMFSR